jgi:hypothetical protein
LKPSDGPVASLVSVRARQWTALIEDRPLSQSIRQRRTPKWMAAWRARPIPVLR